MNEIDFLVVAAAVLGGGAAFRLLTYRFPHPADIATISIFYYTLPLSFAAIVLGDSSAGVFLDPAAADRSLEIESAAYAVVGAACLQLGRIIAARVRFCNVHYEFGIAPSDIDKTRFALVVLISGIALGILLYGRDAFLAGYDVRSTQSTASLGNAFIYLFTEWIGLVIAYGLVVQMATRRRIGLVALGCAISVLLLLVAVRGKRLEVIAALLPIGLLGFGVNRFLRSPWVRILVTAGVAVLVSALASVRFGDVPTTASVLFNLVSEGIFAGHSLPGILEKLHSGQIDYEYGTRVVAGFLGIVPRFLWPEKDDFLYAGNQALDGVSPLGATNIVAEVVLQGGWVAVVAWFSILGFMFEVTHRSLKQFDDVLRARRLPGGLLGYLVIVTSLIPHFRDGLISTTKIALQSACFLYVVAGIRWDKTPTWQIHIRRRTDLRSSEAPRTVGSN